MREEIKNIIESTSMGKLEKEAVLNSLLNLHIVMQTLPKRLSNSAYIRAKNSTYEDFMEWWDKQVQVMLPNATVQCVLMQ